MTLNLREVLRGLRLALFAMAFAAAAHAATNVLQITYDAAGRITNLTRQAAAGFAITGFDPASAPVGAAVTIYGTGFDAVPANNVVKFNGVAAAVSASVSGSISTTVPAGATTGRITVTIGSATATSPQDFVVTVPGAPTISSFTPVTGASATAVSVSGSAFDAGTTVKLNGVSASATIAGPGNLSFTVPASAASGRISATNAIGTGVSAQDFIVPPAGVAAADIISKTRITIGGSAGSISVGTQNKYALVLFDGVAGAYVTLQFRQWAVSPTNASVSYKVIKPDNSVWSTGTLSVPGGSPTIILPKLPTTGTYSILVVGGAATVSASVSIATDPTLTVDGAALAASMDMTSQRLRFLVNATAGQRLGLGMLGVTMLGGGGAQFDAYRPDGQVVGNLVNCGNNETCDGEFTAAIAGVYEIIVAGTTGGRASFSLQASTELTGSLAPDTPQAVALTRAGQDMRFTASLTAGDSVGLAIFNAAFNTQNQSVQVTVLKPDGSQYVSGNISTWGGYMELGSVPATGTYTLVMDPSHGDYGSFGLVLLQGPMIGTSDAPLAWSAPAVGSMARLRFTATAGQNISVTIASFAYSPTSTTTANMFVNGPGRNQVSNSINCKPWDNLSSCRAATGNLTAGTYSIVLIPAAAVTMSGTASVSTDVTGTLTSGVAQTIAVSRIGQSARYTFSGTAGDSTSFKLLGSTQSQSGFPLNIAVKMPNGSSAGASTQYQDSPMVNLQTLPATGTYTVTIEPSAATTWQTGAIVDPGPLLTVNGSPGTLATTVPGEQLRFRFNGIAGALPQIGITGINVTSGTGYFIMHVINANGGGSNDIYCNQSGPYCDDPWPGPLGAMTAGNYTVILDTYGKSIGGGSVYVSTPLTGSIVIGDPAQTITLDRPGRTARYTFSGTSAQTLRLNWANTSVSGGTVTVAVLRPDGSVLNSGTYTNGTTGGMDITALPSTGTYTVVLDPSTINTTTADISVVTR